MPLIGSDEGSNRGTNPNPGAGSEGLRNKTKRPVGRPRIVSRTETKIEEPTVSAPSPAPIVESEPISDEPIEDPGSGIHLGLGKPNVPRRGATRPPNYRLHVVAALSLTIIITFLAGGKDIISAVKGTK